MMRMNENMKWLMNKKQIDDHQVGWDQNHVGAMNGGAYNIGSSTDHVYPVSRKRSSYNWRDFHDHDHDHDQQLNSIDHQQQDAAGYLQIMHQHQLEIDGLIALQNKKLRLDIGEMKKKHGRRMNAAILLMEEEMMTKIWKLKEEEVARIGKLNCALEERVRALFVENQVLKEVAQSSEATANALRGNLEQLLEEVHDHEKRRHVNNLAEDDQESTSCNADNIEMILAMNNNDNKICKSCREMESCVLLLPCRHLSLCKLCASSVHVCPVCNSPNTTSVHVIFSSSYSSSSNSSSSLI